MKRRYIGYILLLIVVIAISLQGCILKYYIDYKRQDANSLYKQVGTTWRSEDGKITFTIVKEAATINEDGIKISGTTHGIGTMITDEGSIDIIFKEFLYCEVFIRDAASGENLEEGVGDFKHNDQLTVTFKKTTFLEEDTVITFYRVEE